MPNQLTLKLKRFKAIVLLLYVPYAFISTPAVSAFGVAPNKCEVAVEAGGEYTGDFTLTNEEEQDVKVKIFVENWIIEQGRDATQWIHVSPDEVVIPPKGSRSITYRVKVPKSVKGEYTSSIVFRSLNPVQADESIEAIAQVRLAVYVVIKGTEIVEGEISNLEILGLDPFKMSVKIKNSGNIHIRPKGEIEIFKDDAKVGVLQLNKMEGPIFSNAEGEIAPVDGIDLKPGEYKARARVELSPEFIINKEVFFSVPKE